MNHRWGPQLLKDGRARFRLWAPDRQDARLEIDGLAPLPMTVAGEGWLEAEVVAAPGTRYRFLIGDQPAPDPASRAQAGGVDGWSVLTDPEAYRWQQDWRGRPWHEAVILEVHPGLCDGFAGLAERLPALAAMGVTAVELMPIAAFGGTRGWGYDGVLPYAPHESYGTPDALKALVDRAHALGLMMLLDVVYNHFGPDGNYLGLYAKGFQHAERHTPWGGAVAVDRQQVRRFFIDNALMWLEEYRFDGLRFDAVHAIEDDRFLDAMAAEIRTRTAGRHVHLILENEKNDAARLAPGLYDAQWNDDFHNTLHVLLTGEHEGYYGGYAERPTERLARCLAEGFVYQGEVPPGGDHPRGTPSGALATTHFVSFLQNHDQVGNRALGERLIRLADPAKLRAAMALLLLGPQIPMLFMGEEDGSETPFLFFTDFHDELADAVREGRRKEFAKFAAFADPETRERIPDPNALSTFEASRPAPGDPVWRGLHERLLAVRHAEIVRRLAGTHAIGAEVIGKGAVVARWRMGDGRTLTIAINLGDAPVAWPELAGDPLWVEGERGTSGSAIVTLAR